ncbi:MAG: valine--tRNA ligase [Candidatus Binataceae bacterium]|nr:valine--tRNA ligase [Candidatus Binataceae bacterium]
MELSKTFDPKTAEEHWFQLWIDRGYFTADPARAGAAFAIVIPPPNVTGQLHLGHALNVTLQDVIVRTRRMQGFNTLWMPGTDHAGIATQNVVEREIAKTGKSRHDLGREEFVARVWQWKETYGGKILHQLRRLGASCDWSRERFTLDPGLSRAVTRVFVMLYRDGLIERDRRLINWCPRCETAISDLEVEHKDAKGNLWYIRYPLSDGGGSITVATTRPETMLGDTAVAINPDDERYRAMAGRTIRLPLARREIPIVADPSVDREFGSGAVKITPAHDFNDFELGRRHNLPQISVMDTHGRMSAEAGVYQGLTREDARKRIVEDLTALELIEKIEPHAHKVGVCSRCDTVVEPMLSLQWFVRVNKPGPSGMSLAGAAIAAVEQGDTTFHPKFWENTYFAWMRNIQDWCISRQLWWGHRIPAYWCDACNDGTPIVAEERPAACPRCGGADLRQDDDVLDTWFSSGLWPFSTLGWPAATPELARYYPTSLLLTGFDIIFFWVARMMMLGIYCLDDRPAPERVPFRGVYITPLVRDQYGKKMTKSRGNVVDPLEIMEKYGTDAVRFTLAQLAVQGRDLILSDDRLAASRAFANKIWNAARFVMMNLDGASHPLAPVDTAQLGLAERWIMSRLDNAVRDVTAAIDAYEFNRAALIVYQFVWHEFCDWYIELAKDPLKAGGDRQAAARFVLVSCFDGMLRMLHPFMPFISEEIWQALRPYFNAPGLAEHLAIAKFPTPAETPWLTPDEATTMNECIAATEAVNSLRALVGHHPGQKIDVQFRPRFKDAGSVADMQYQVQMRVSAFRPYFELLAKAHIVSFGDFGKDNTGRTVTTLLDWCEISVGTPEEFDFAKARELTSKKLAEVRKHLEQHLARLGSKEFMAKADRDTRESTRARSEQLKDEELRLGVQLRDLASAD